MYRARAHAVRALANLAMSDDNKARIARTTRALQVLVAALETQSGAAQCNAAAALGNLAQLHTDCQGRVARQPRAVPALVEALGPLSLDAARNPVIQSELRANHS